MKILVVGGGGREHAICWKLSNEKNVEKIYCAPGNPGIAEVAECVNIGDSDIDELAKFVKENEMVKVCSYNGNVFAIEPPLFVELAITETEPGFKGDTAQGATKPATVETGATVMVPLFVENGDVLKIDTRTGEYLSRV